ncbi:hypothetical protein Neosp_012703 [[Neocosmospora] mangrovei]
MGINSTDYIGFTNEAARTSEAEQAIVTYTQQDTRNFGSAMVLCTPTKHGKKSWHKGGTNPNAREHITVAFQGPTGKHITTLHLDRHGRRV